MKEAELLFTPGCEAGSKYCGECDKPTRKATCNIFGVGICGLVIFENEQMCYSEDDIKFYRCEECIEAEAKAKELRDKVERLERALAYLAQFDEAPQALFYVESILKGEK